MFVVIVDIQVKPECIEAFLVASRANHEGTRREPGNRRFDVLQALDDPNRFQLYEVYVDEAAFRAHQQNAHYFAWRDAVGPMMAAPRTARKFSSRFPDPWQP